MTSARSLPARPGLSRRSFLAGLGGVGALGVLAACGSAPAPSPMAPTGPAPAAPAALAVPAGQHLVLTATVAQGSQVYACHGTTWTLKQPAAEICATENCPLCTVEKVETSCLPTS